MQLKFLFITCFLFAKQILPAQKNYFQQQTNYKISVALDDSLHELTGFETIEYTNNAPDALTEIYFHLWPNAYKNNSTALAKEFLRNGDLKFYYAKKEQRGFIDNLNFKVDNESVLMITDSIHIDICRIKLNTPLLPGKKITITTPFHIKIPDAKFSRLGHIGQSYFITQWYPKPAVYDTNGWHPLPYVSQGEFYSEFGDFEVDITVPANYLVAASGSLQTESEIAFIENKIEETKQVKEFANDNTFPPSSAQTKTLSYKISNAHDFAWFADKRFNVLGSEVELPYSKQKVKTYAFFTNSKPAQWKKAVHYIDSAVYYYSKWNGDYQYPTCTAIDGTIAAGGGMEYPTITIINSTSSDFMMEDVIVHEVGHNWFYGMLGSNEREYAWMDEGINSFNEMRYIYTKMRDPHINLLTEYIGLPSGISNLLGMGKYNQRDVTMLQYRMAARSNNDQPLNLKAEKFSFTNYGFIVYMKSALIFEHLKNYLGEEVFDQCMKSYFEKWKFKHPSPVDLKNVFEETTKRNLDWFFDDLINTKGKIDYRFSSIKKIDDETYTIKIKNAGNISSPVAVSAIKNNVVTHTQWFDGFENKKSFIVKCNTCDAFRINALQESAELNDFNNTIRTKGILKKFNPLQLKFFAGAENKNTTQISYLPAVGYNVYDGFMVGALLHNRFIPEKKFEYSIAPLYGLESNSVAGNAYMNYTAFKLNCFFDRFDFTNRAKYFTSDNLKPDMINSIKNTLNAKYIFWSARVSARFKKSNTNYSTSNFIAIKTTNLWKDEFYYNKETPYLKNKHYNFTSISYQHQNNDKLDPGIFLATVETGEKYTKACAERIQEITVGKYKKALMLRLFAGAFLNAGNTSVNSYFKLSGMRGVGDYMMEEYFFGRNENEGLWKNQFLVSDAGLKTYYPLSTNKWMLGFNAAFKLPVPFIKLFVDAAAMERGDKLFDGAQAIKYDGGVCFSVLKNAFEIYIPLVYSPEIKNFYTLNNYKFANRIRFIFDLQKLNPVLLRQQVF